MSKNRMWRIVVCVGLLVAGFAAWAATPDEQVRGLVKEARALLEADKLDEAVDKVQEAIAVKDVGYRTQGTVFNVYSDVMRKRGDTVKADKSLLKAYDFLLKARDAAKDDAERKSMVRAADGVAERLTATPDGKALLENYLAKKREKRREQEAAEKAAKAEARATKAAQAAAKRGGKSASSASSSSSAVANYWNPWKKGVEPRKFDSKTKRDEELPWTYDEAEKLLGKSVGRGWSALRTIYEALAHKYGKQRALNWYEYILEKPTKFDIPKGDMCHAWNFYGFYAFNALDQSRVRQTREWQKRNGLQPGSYYGYRASPSIRMFDDLKTFPRDTATIVFPTENIWVKGRHTVHAKDLGWNATDATECLKKALDDANNDIVILDKMESPWLITGVKVPPNKTIIFEKGVRVHATEGLQRANTGNTLFALHGTENVALIGRGDVVIGTFSSAEARAKYQKEEGGTGIHLDNAKHILIRDLTAADCGCDGLTLGGCGPMNNDVYVENVILDHNARQGMSMCNGCDVFMKNVKFLNTVGAQPMAGIDFEPSIQEVEATCNIYLIDCEFRNNRGGDIVFSESSTYPVTVLFKNCIVGPRDYTSIIINALCGLYQGNGTDAPSDIIFDGCTIKGVAWASPVSIDNANLFHVTFRNCDLVETKGGSATSPFEFCLNREYYSVKNDNRTWYQKEGSLAFDNTRVKGWNGAEALKFTDRTGHYTVHNIYGKLSMNGKPVDMTKYRHEAPDFAYQDVRWHLIPPTELKPLPASSKLNFASTDVSFCWRAPWWVGDLKYEVLTKVTDTGYSAEMVTNATAAVKAANPGTCFRTACGDGLFRMESPTTVYFMVPAGKGEATLKLVDAGSVELLKGRKKVVKTYTSRDLVGGYTYVHIKQDAKPQLYGLHATGGRMTFKFFEPFSGFVAADPSALPMPYEPETQEDPKDKTKKGKKK